LPPWFAAATGPPRTGAASSTRRSLVAHARLVVREEHLADEVTAPGHTGLLEHALTPAPGQRQIPAFSYRPPGELRCALGRAA
jgi:hypothetical protein